MWKDQAPDRRRYLTTRPYINESPLTREFPERPKHVQWRLFFSSDDSTWRQDLMIRSGPSLRESLSRGICATIVCTWAYEQTGQCTEATCMAKSAAQALPRRYCNGSCTIAIGRSECWLCGKYLTCRRRSLVSLTD